MENQEVKNIGQVIDEIIVSIEVLDTHEIRYKAYCKIFGEYSVYGIGNSYNEAILSFLEVREDHIKASIKKHCEMRLRTDMKSATEK